MIEVLKTGVRKGLSSGWFLLKVTIPTSLVVSCLDYFGFISWLAGYFKPAMKLFGLPGEAAFALASGALLNVYSGIAVITSLPGVFTWRDLNIIAVMMLISHALIVETAIQKKCGMKVRTIIFTRLFSSALAGLAIFWLFPNPGPLMNFTSQPSAADQTFAAFLLNWTKGTSFLIVQILLILLTLMVTYEILNYYRVVRRFSAWISPLLRLLALSPDSAFIWVAGTFIGLGYGSGIIIPEVEKGDIDRDEVARINLSLAISHSWLEDTLLFVVIGAHWLLVLVPRIVLSIAAIHVYNYFTAVRRRRAEARP